MGKLSAREAAIMRMQMYDEQALLEEGMQNTHPEMMGAEYPRMLYRKTDEEQREYQTDIHAKCGETYLVVNDYGTSKLRCETIVADSQDDAETLAADGWETSPEAAYGLKPGLAVAVSAKDARIAELEAMVAGQKASEPVGYEAQGTSYDPGSVGHEAVGRRGPGRPRKVDATDASPT